MFRDIFQPRTGIIVYSLTMFLTKSTNAITNPIYKRDFCNCSGNSCVRLEKLSGTFIIYEKLVIYFRGAVRHFWSIFINPKSRKT